MKKVLVLMMVLTITMSLAACGGSNDTPSQVEKTEFTEEQIALAEDFLSMAEEFDAIADKVNASPELLANEELVTAMNELADEIIKLDEYFESPETLTPEVMGALTVTIEVGRLFIAEASEILDEIGQ
jgi:ABC-type glycerol-3-phosphate transport system substrate-binding protein